MSFIYTEWFKSKRNLRRALCTGGCGKKYLINNTRLRLETYRYRLGIGSYWTYFGRDREDGGFDFLKSKCCQYPLARTRIKVGDPVERMME